MGILLATFMNVLVITDHVSFASGHESFIRGVMYLHEHGPNRTKGCIPVSLKTAPDLYCYMLRLDLRENICIIAVGPFE